MTDPSFISLPPEVGDTRDGYRITQVRPTSTGWHCFIEWLTEDARVQAYERFGWQHPTYREGV